MPLVYVALGANLDQPQQQLDRACLALTALVSEGHLRVSSYYQSRPMGEVSQPDYLNAVAEFTCALSPLALLDALQAIEQAQGRTREIRWGPRTLDLDLLLYGNDTFDHPRLQLPHYGMKQRAFVLLPLQELAPNLLLPCGTPLSALIDSTMANSLRRLGKSG